VVAAHRELTGYEDPETALGPAPKSGQVEAYASWRSAWRALGRPESGRDELEMSDGQLLVRMRAWEREKAWGPAFVGNELAGTHQALDSRRGDAAMRRAEADAVADASERERLLTEAAEAEALADVLSRRTAELEAADDARGLWYAHTAETRAAADRARLELAARNANTEAQPLVTADEWLDVHHAHMAEDDQHREVTAEHDLTENVQARVADAATVEPWDAAEVDVADVRDVAAAEDPVVESEEMRVPSAEETAEEIDRAQRALREIAARQVVEQRHADEEAQATEMYRRNTSDAADAAEMADDDGVVSGR